MAETTISDERPRSFHFDWVLPVMFRPRRLFEKIAAFTRSVWLTPIVILMLTGVVLVLITGAIKQAATAQGQVDLPPGFEYYTPEQQAQFQQALSATSGPAFTFVFPAIISLLSVWVGWLLVGGMLHLMLTLLGGRGSTTATMNIFAWCSLPLAVRAVVQSIVILFTKQAIQGVGLSGFAPEGTGLVIAFATTLLGLIDIYLVWQILLTIIGIHAGTGLTKGRTISAVGITFALVLFLQSVMGMLITLLSNVTAIRPFF